MVNSRTTAAAMERSTTPSDTSIPGVRPEVQVLDTPHPRDLKRAYEELRVKYQRASTALATAAHDLRTPLAVISGYVELLIHEKLGPITEKQHTVLEDMQVSSI